MSQPCPICHGEEWVCEDHPDKPWFGGCCGGAGMPCTCSPLHNDRLSSSPESGWQQSPEHLSQVQSTQSLGGVRVALCDESYRFRDEMLADAEARGECYFMAAGRIDGLLTGIATCHG